MLTHEKQILQKQIFETPVSSSKTVDIPTDSPISSLESLTNKSNASTPSVAFSSVTKKAQDNIIDEAMLLQYLNDPPEVAAAKAADIIAATKRQDTLVAHQMAMERESSNRRNRSSSSSSRSSGEWIKCVVKQSVKLN